MGGDTLKSRQVSDQIAQLSAQLHTVECMSDHDVCRAYNADSKSDIIDSMREELEQLIESLDNELGLEEERDFLYQKSLARAGGDKNKLLLIN